MNDDYRLNQDYPDDHDTQDPVQFDAVEETEAQNVELETDDEALEVLLSRPGSSALVEPTPDPDAPLEVENEVDASADDLDTVAPDESVIEQEDAADNYTTHDDIQLDVSDQDTDDHVALVADTADKEDGTLYDERDYQPAPLAADPFSADTGEHQQTPTVDRLDTPPPASVEAADDDTAPHPIATPLQSDQFENAHTSPIDPRPAQQVPAPTPLPTPERGLVKIPAIPAAPLTPPPPAPAANRPAEYSVQQRVQAYAYAGYRLVHQSSNEIIMSYGKPLGFFWWIVGAASVVGMVWYFFVMLLSGFQRDKVYIALEPNGHVYEEGPGAAHVRHRRSQNARRWGVVGVFMVLISIFSLFLVIVAISVLSGRYAAELNAAYPEFGLFDAAVDPDSLDATQVQNVRVVVLSLIILMALSLSGMVIGTLMSFIGYLQSAAYRVGVAPLPYLR